MYYFTVHGVCQYGFRSVFAYPCPCVLTTCTSVCTCILLWQHRPVDDPLEGSDPVLLFRLCLAGEQELPVWGDDGDSLLPAMTLRGWRQAGLHCVAVLLAADEHLPPGIGVLQWGEGQVHRAHTVISIMFQTLNL